MPSQSQLVPGQPPDSPRWRRVARRIVAVGGWVSLTAAALGWLALRGGDLYWPSTLLMFGPRWPFLLLPIVLLPASLVLHRRGLRTILPAIVVAGGPVMGLCVSWNTFDADPSPTDFRLRVLTCNMHDARTDSVRLDNLIGSTEPDVIALQQSRDRFVPGVLGGSQWHTHRAPSLFFASRFPIRDVESVGKSSTGDSGLVMRYDLETPTGIVAVFSLHLATPRDGLSALVHRDLGGLTAVSTNSELRWSQSRRVAEASGRVEGPAILVGDFNTPPHSAIFREVWDGYTDAFASSGSGWGYTFTTRLTGLRIDHILVGGGVRPIKCWVGPDIGSPHRPVLADVVWSAR